MTVLTHRSLIPNHHTPPVCPPNQDAECVNCGDALKFHWVESVNTAKDIGATCPNTYGDVFALAGGESLDCPEAVNCGVCGVSICSEHASEFTTCVDSQHDLHHLDCRMSCHSCRESDR